MGVARSGSEEGRGPVGRLRAKAAGPAVAALLRDVVANPGASNSADFLTDREREILQLVEDETGLHRGMALTAAGVWLAMREPART